MVDEKFDGELELALQAQAENSRVVEQAPPVANNRPAIWDLVMEDFKARDKEGRRKYGVPLQGFNGRDVLVDAYQEALDLCVYLRQAIYEREHRGLDLDEVGARCKNALAGHRCHSLRGHGSVCDYIGPKV